MLRVVIRYTVRLSANQADRIEERPYLIKARCTPKRIAANCANELNVWLELPSTNPSPDEGPVQRLAAGSGVDTEAVETAGTVALSLTDDSPAAQESKYDEIRVG